jgi:nickel/cobalt transporter (NicO) family protein
LIFISVCSAAVSRRVRPPLVAKRLALRLVLLGLAVFLPSYVLGQGVHHPFAVGANEGAVSSAQGIMGWILAKESGFYRLLSTAIRAAKLSSGAPWGLIALSLGYGIFHAAGPGHGKAVIASYMLANERALRRGLVIAFGAALLQGLSAVAIVGISAIVFQAAAARMTAAANVVEIVSYAGIALLGAALVTVKGAALLAAWRMAPAGAAYAGVGGTASTFRADDCMADHVHGPGCGHFHAPDPRTLGAGFSWKSAVLTMIAAGARPCSGAILVLVFALAQGIFSAGIFAVVAMSLGTAITTAALASAAVFAKNAAVKYAKPGSRRALMAGRLFEFAAASAVLGLGVTLLLAVLAGGVSAN